MKPDRHRCGDFSNFRALVRKLDLVRENAGKKFQIRRVNES